MPYLGLQRKTLPSIQVSNLASGAITVPSLSNVGDEGSWEHIASNEISTTTNTTAFTNIPANYESLTLIVNGGNTSGYKLYMNFNSDTGNNYGRHRISQWSNTPSGISGTGYNDQQTQGSADISNYSGMSFTSNSSCSAAIVHILDYSNSNKYTSTRIYAYSDAGSSAYIYTDQESNVWSNTAVVNRIDIGSLTQNYVTGTTFDLYGQRKF